jgi:hypothetical protein
MDWITPLFSNAIEKKAKWKKGKENKKNSKITR